MGAPYIYDISHLRVKEGYVSGIVPAVFIRVSMDSREGRDRRTRITFGESEWKKPMTNLDVDSRK
jgi:hypothetical protein